MATTDMDDYWNDVEVAMEYAHLVAFDGCHKIYLAMDEEQAEWFRKRPNFALLNRIKLAVVVNQY